MTTYPLPHSPPPFHFSQAVKIKRLCELFFLLLVTVIYISSPFCCFSPWIRQACSNLRFTLKVTESPLTWQRLCVTRTATPGGDPLVWAGAFQLGHASRFHLHPKAYGETFLNIFSPFPPSGHPDLYQFSAADGFPWGWSLKDSQETFLFPFHILEVKISILDAEHQSVFDLFAEQNIQEGSEGMQTPTLCYLIQETHMRERGSNPIWLTQKWQPSDGEEFQSRCGVSE